MNLDRESLRRALSNGGPIAVISEANRLGYVKGEFSNGADCIATPDADDWIMFPGYTMRQSEDVLRQKMLMPTVDMGR